MCGQSVLMNEITYLCSCVLLRETYAAIDVSVFSFMFGKYVRLFEATICQTNSPAL